MGNQDDNPNGQAVSLSKGRLIRLEAKLGNLVPADGLSADLPARRTKSPGAPMDTSAALGALTAALTTLGGQLERERPRADKAGRMVMTIFAGIAEFERTLIISRTSDGRLAAKARGVTFGRPKKMRPDQQELARELVRDGKSISAVARTFDVHPATIYRVIER